MIARDCIGQHLFVSVPDVRRRVGVIDRGGDEERLCHFARQTGGLIVVGQARRLPTVRSDRYNRFGAAYVAAPIVSSASASPYENRLDFLSRHSFPDAVYFFPIVKWFSVYLVVGSLGDFCVLWLSVYVLISII